MICGPRFSIIRWAGLVLPAALAAALCDPGPAPLQASDIKSGEVASKVVTAFSDAVGLRFAYPEDLAAGANADALGGFQRACRLLGRHRLKAPGRYRLTDAVRARAASLLGQAIRQAPDFAAAHYLLALIRAPALQYGPAVSAYHKATLVEQRFRKDPLRSLFRTLVTDCNRAADYDSRGGHFLVRRKYAQARRQYERAVSIMPDFAGARVNLGLAYMMSGDLDKALAEEIEAIRLNPRLVEAYYNLGKVYQKRGRERAAVDAFREAVRLADVRGPDISPGEKWDPGAVRRQNEVFRLQSAQRLASLGNAFWAAGEVDSAIASYEKAAEMDPGIADVHYNLGIVYEKAGRPAEAIRHWEAFLSLARSDPALDSGIREAKKRLPRLRGMLAR